MIDKGALFIVLIIVYDKGILLDCGRDRLPLRGYFRRAWGGRLTERTADGMDVDAWDGRRLMGRMWLDADGWDG